MLRIIAVIVGIIFIFCGVAGFLSQFNINGYLFGLFEVSLLHNMAHLIIGVLAIMAATRYLYAKHFFKVLGIFLTLVALVGFWRSGDLFLMHTNTADNILYLVMGVIALYLGFSESARAY